MTAEPMPQHVPAQGEPLAPAQIENGSSDRALATSREIYGLLAGAAGEPAIAMRSWTGETWGPAAAAATLVLKHPGSLRALCIPPTDLTAAEAYVYDDVDIEDSMLAGLEFASRLETFHGPSWQSLRLYRLLRSLPGHSRRLAAARPTVFGRLHSRRRDRQAISHHYDTGNDFFQLFLDEAMVYSCAAFLDPTEDLAAAQRRKLDLICRKLQLEPGQQFLDIGCGWGALVCHAAKHYGVTATGVTLSEAQAELATERARDAGLAERVSIRVQDYRDVRGTFDAIASIGMFEHVGSGQLDRYFSQVSKLLHPGGVFLNHGIVTRDRKRSVRRRTFINTYVFPDGELIPLGRVVDSAEHAGFEVRDAESLRTSYGLTLRRWVANLEANQQAARREAGETAFRIWRLYMAGSALAFERGSISVHQLLLQPPARLWTYGRSHLLAGDDRSECRRSICDPFGTQTPSGIVSTRSRNTRRHGAPTPMRRSHMQTLSSSRRVVLSVGLAIVVALGVFAFLNRDSSPADDGSTVELSLGEFDALASCLAFDTAILADMPMAFRGTAETVDDSAVTLSVDRWYKGGDASTVHLKAEHRSPALIAGFEFEPGEQYLISAAEGSVNYCGYSGQATDDLAAAYETAFGA